MTDEGCPHGLEPEWCSLCKAQVAKGLAIEQAKIAQANRVVGPAGRRGERPARPARRTRATAGPGSAKPATPLDPAQALSGLRPLLFHAAGYGAWASIAEHGLRTPNQLASGHPGLSRVRDEPLDVPGPDGIEVRIRDQRALARADIAAHLDGISLAEWLEITNERVFLFASQNELTTMLARYQSQGQDVIVFDTAGLLAAASGRVEVTNVNSGAPVPWGNCACRSRATFMPLASYRGTPGDIHEVTVVGGLDAVGGLVTRVVRHHPDRSTEVLVARHP